MTALLHLYNLSFSRGSEPLFEHLTLTITATDRIGLVGHNGSGKSTLMALVTGAEQPDDGEIRMPRGQRVALVEQFVPTPLLDGTLEQALLSVLPEEHRKDERYRIDTLLQQLNFPPQQWSQPLRTLSGGEQNLALLARAVLAGPELLLLDEPGNHMDVVALSQLQHFLTHDFAHAFMMISHDRELLDSCCNRTVFLRDKSLYSFDLPYESARAALAARDEQAAQQRENQEKEIRRVESSARRLAQWGRDFDNEDLARKAKSMQKRVERLKQGQTVVSRGSGLDLHLNTENIRARSILVLEDLSVTTPDGQRQLLSCEFQHIKPGDRIALLGQNGIGKSTTLNRLLAAQQEPDDTIRLNPNASIGFYDQKLEQFATTQSRFDWLRDRSEGPDSRIKQALLQAGVPYTDFDRRVNTLSGGECARLMFMLFRLNQPNFLILDEPTNHIDIEGREQLERQLIESGATLLITSHDRRFIERIASRWWWIADGQLQELHDPDHFYQSLSAQHHTQQHSPHTSQDGNTGDRAAGAGQVTQAQSEELLLERLESLEKLLKADQSRKPKFQKPDRQRQWQQEIDSLWAALEKKNDATGEPGA